ncbi:hypothetical protein C8R44DRAFT_813466 [Mycena epipterygia]|nr:hypothetical protein C8R44DRAFT_813466 [Mycena epipterygia]
MLTPKSALQTIKLHPRLTRANAIGSNVDLPVGAEDPTLATRNKFALVCGKCFMFNRLVPGAVCSSLCFTRNACSPA